MITLIAIITNIAHFNNIELQNLTNPAFNTPHLFRFKCYNTKKKLTQLLLKKIELVKLFFKVYNSLFNWKVSCTIPPYLVVTVGVCGFLLLFIPSSLAQFMAVSGPVTSNKYNQLFI